MQNIQERESAIWWKEKFLEVALISLKLYKKTNEEQYYKHAEYFKAEADKKNGEYNRLLQ